jgi:hypothetical protein
MKNSSHLKSIVSKNLSFLGYLIVALTLLLTLTSSPASAHETKDGQGCSHPTGFYLGLDAGFGGSGVSYHDNDRFISEDPEGGGMGGFRIGYGLTPKLALSLEGHGFGRGDEGDDDYWGIGVGVVALTWRPRAGGFYLRAGLGAGGAEFRSLDMDNHVEIEERLAWLFAVGHDWTLSEHFTLGLALQNIGMDAGEITGYEDDQVGASGAVVQFTWHP